MVSWDAKIGKRYNQSIYVFFEHCGLLQVVLVQNCGLPNCLFLKLAERWILILDPPFLTCNSILSFLKKKWIISVQDDTISIFNYNKQRHAIYWLSGSLPKCPCYFKKDKKSLISQNVVCCMCMVHTFSKGRTRDSKHPKTSALSKREFTYLFVLDPVWVDAVNIPLDSDNHLLQAALTAAAASAIALLSWLVTDWLLPDKEIKKW